jgi:nitroimidazol reductase NimA-like FMN-containing flavoprotein (pyridoxamine 5'-phosphate oxidase superfamily)
MPGKKIESLRADPHVCIQLDQIETAQDWHSVLVEGLFQELPDDETGHTEHMYAWSLLQKKNDWWEPGAYKPGEPNISSTPSLPVFFSVQIESLPGRRAISD